ncbi:oxidoreductase [Rhodococcus koreensis]|uniref:Putative quinone oxidoreductase, YhdH/YhfP family n=1 Tax=Rhodococcus koreensis TaxID=99653 RepID=A0A1H4IGC0_9NOCA|nr:oxidoreductase [Rhodococcus koreensis]SEB33154.1 putative quinone oxidoreductase, YhdH/YhfP family [Rhodococcus koreensis]
MALTDSFRAFVVHHADGHTTREVRDLRLDDLGAGDVVIRVTWSSVNYKDGLASSANGKVARLTTLIPGIDLAGTVVNPGSSGLDVGTEVIVHGYDVGVAHSGGFSQFARVPADWVVPLPDTLTARQAMSVGTAGFTAALSVRALEVQGLQPGNGPVLVTGATGGVGSVAVNILAGKGYEVAASTGKEDAAAWLTKLGATEVLTRAETSSVDKPLQRERWAGAIDCVGGNTLAYILSSLKYDASVAASGNTGGVKLPTTVFPFILRGVSLIGIDSVQCPIGLRRTVWQQLGTDLRPGNLDALGTSEVTLDELSGALDHILDGETQGRTLVYLD